MKTNTVISLIAAVTPGGVIGNKNEIPWKISEDMLLFKKITSHHPVIMGRKTFESLTRPLKDRRNLIVSGSWQRLPPGVPEGAAELYPNLEEAIQAAGIPGEGMIPGEIFIIGGARIYRQTLPLADRLYISRIHKDYKGDTFFPRFSPEDWALSGTEPHDEFTLEIYNRKK